MRSWRSLEMADHGFGTNFQSNFLSHSPLNVKPEITSTISDSTALINQAIMMDCTIVFLSLNQISLLLKRSKRNAIVLWLFLANLNRPKLVCCSFPVIFRYFVCENIRKIVGIHQLPVNRRRQRRLCVSLYFDNAQSESFSVARTRKIPHESHTIHDYVDFCVFMFADFRDSCRMVRSEEEKHQETERFKIITPRSGSNALSILDSAANLAAESFRKWHEPATSDFHTSRAN